VEPSVSGIGVLDKCVAVLDALEARGPSSLAELMATASLPRATAHRLAVALEAHGLVRREPDGRFALGLALVGLGRAAAAGFSLTEAAAPVLERLRDETGESVQLFVRAAGGRLCVASLESAHGLRWIVPVGAVMPLDRGSAGRVLSPPRPGESPQIRPSYVESVEEREAGVASVSAPIRDAGGQVVAAVSVSGPIERLTRAPGRRYGTAVAAAAHAIEAVINA
jgi:DNA-binding IclR family transcriptional regulator